MSWILTILGCVLLAFFAWIAFYILVFTASCAWHSGAKAERRNSTAKELNKLSERVKRIQSELKQVLDDEVERQETVH